MALTTHKEKNREIFVTNEGSICHVKGKLEEKYGINVMNPERRLSFTIILKRSLIL